MTDLIPLEKANAVELFKDGGLDPLLDKISTESKALAEGLNVENPADRKEIASIAYKVSRSKTTIDNARKNLVADLKKQTKAIDTEGKKARDYLDLLRDEIRKPLNEWEADEEQRIADHQLRIENIKRIGELCVDWMHFSVDELRSKMELLKTTDASTYQEFSEQAQAAISQSIQIVADSIDKRRDYDLEQAELERLRKEEAERQQKEAEARAEQARKEREEQIRREAAEAEKRKAEERERKLRKEKEREERQRIAAEERIKIQKQEAEARIERERLASEQRAKQAVEEERRKEAARKAAEEEAQRKREANKRHRAKINREAAASLVKALECTDDFAQEIVTAIAKHEIDHINIEY